MIRLHGSYIFGLLSGTYCPSRIVSNETALSLYKCSLERLRAIGEPIHPHDEQTWDLQSADRFLSHGMVNKGWRILHETSDGVCTILYSGDGGFYVLRVPYDTLIDACKHKCGYGISLADGPTWPVGTQR